MSIASPGSNSSTTNNNDQDLTDLQINALLSSTLNSPSVSHNNSISGGSTNTNNNNNANANDANNDIDMALFNLLSNDATIIEDAELKHIKKEPIIPEIKKEHSITNTSSSSSAIKKQDDIKIIKQEFSQKLMNDDDDDDDSSRISLYARLDFPNFTFYVQTLQVLLGRKIDDNDDNTVDVHLGATKAISRRHGKIFYNFGTQRFEISILGRNGAFVDESFVETGVTLPLKNNTKIQIGEIPFQFVLPTPGSNLKKNSTRINPSDAINLKSSLYNNNNNNHNNNHNNNNNNTTSPSRVSRQGSETEGDQSKDKKLKEKPTKKVKQPKKIYTLEEIPEQYRTKPSCSYSHLIAVCLKERSTERGMSLSEIYKGIQDLYPYYHYCPDGWQSSVRHNLSLNKSFKKVSKEGKGWLWGLDEEFCAEKEKLNNTVKKTVTPVQQKLTISTTLPRPMPPQSSLSTLKNNGSPPPSSVSTIPGRLPPPPAQLSKPMSASPLQNNNKSIAQIASEIKRPVNSSANPVSTVPTSLSQPNQNQVNKPMNNTATNIQAQLAANRSISKPAPSVVSKQQSVPGTNVIKPGSPSPPASQSQSQPQSLPQQQQQQPASSSSTVATPTSLKHPTSTSSTPASNTPNSSKLSGDTMKALNYLQQELIRLTKDRKGLDKKTTTQILTQALAMTISQVNQAAKNSGMTGNPLVLLIDKNPQHLTKILTAALNAATYQVTKGKVKPGMVNNNVSSSANISGSNTPVRQQSPPKPTAPIPAPTSKVATTTTSTGNNTHINRPYPGMTQKQQQQQQQQPSTKPPINDKFRPPHVTNPMPQQISRPATKPVVASIQRPPVSSVLQQQHYQASTISPLSKTPKPKAFSKPPAYNARPSLSPLPLPLSPPITTRVLNSNNNTSDTSSSSSLVPPNSLHKPKMIKPSSYATPLQRVNNNNTTILLLNITPVKIENEIKQDLLDNDPLNDPEFDKVLESFSRQATPGLDENENVEPVDLDKLLAEDGYFNDTSTNVERGMKRELEVDVNLVEQNQQKFQKAE